MDWKQWTARLQRAKKESGLTDADLSDALALRGVDVQRATVNHWLNGRRPVTIDNFFTLCEILGADPGMVLFDSPVLQRLTDPGSAANHSVAGKPSPATSLPYAPTKARQFKAARLKARRK